MDAAQKPSRQEEFLKNQDTFRRNAFMIINEMVEQRKTSGHPTELVDEILHSIFFLGEIMTPKISPQSIVPDDDMLNVLKGRYPLPFNFYSSRLPQRSPFSCVLDMIVRLTGQEKEKQIMKKLQELILQLKQNGAVAHLFSTTICVSQKNKIPNSVRYYGVSMSTSGCNPGRIVLAASCFSAWDSYVAGAVMTYDAKKTKKSYFDGTVKLPEQVRCQAFRLSTLEEIPPCKSCGDLFGLKTDETSGWAYGNCAEAESVSNLFKNEKEVREAARPTSETCTNENRKMAEESVLKDLRVCLRMLKFQWDNNYYIPQMV